MNLAGIREKFKRGFIQAIDRDARVQARDEREVKRTNQINRLESANLSETLKREKMRSGEKPLRIGEYAKSKLRESRNNLKVKSIQSLNRDKLADDFKESAKDTGRKIVQGAKNPATREKIRRYARQFAESEGSNPDPLGMNVIFGSNEPAPRTRRGQRQTRDYDVLGGDPFGLGGYPGMGRQKRSRRNSDWDWMR